MASTVKTTKDKLAKLKGFFSSAINHNASSSYRENMIEDVSFYDGDGQLSDADKQELKDRGQPIIIINKIFSKMNNLMGGQRFTRTRLGVVGRTPQDFEPAIGITDLLRYISERTKLHDEESETFDDGIISGLGWLECLVDEDFEGNPDVKILSERPENMFLDPYSRRYDLSDARFVGRAKWIDLEDAQALFPKKSKELEQAITSETEADDVAAVRHGPLDDYDLESSGGVSYFDKSRRRVRLVEMWYRERKINMWMQDDRGQNTLVKDIDEAKELFAESFGEEAIDFEGLTDEEALEVMGVVKRKEKVIRLAFYAGDIMLSDKLTPFTHRLNINKFPFIPFFCFRKRTKGNRGEPYGFVRQMRDAQRELNKRRSKAMHILNTKQIIMDEGAVDDKETLREEAARPDGIIEKKLNKTLEINSDINMAVTQFSVMEQSGKDLNDISGQFDEAQGKETNARSGRAIARRTSASNQNTVMVFDNFRRTKNLVGDFTIGLIKQFFTEEFTFSILDDEQAARTVVLNGAGSDGTISNDVKQALVDIHVEEMPMSPSAQAEEFDELVELARGGVPIPPDVLIAASSLRNKEALIQRLQAAVVPPEGEPAGSTSET